jgi:hypothetical protein
MEVIRFFETLVTTNKTTRRHKPEDNKSKLNRKEIGLKVVDWNQLSQNWFKRRISFF